MPKPEEMATRRADQVKEQVKDAGQLTDDQYKKVYDLYLKQSKDMQAKMNEGGGGFGAFNMEDMQKQQEATNKALKEILSEEQFKAYQKAQEEMMKRFQQGGGFGG
jgi:DnaJ-class molecular chaperone